MPEVEVGSNTAAVKLVARTTSPALAGPSRLKRASRQPWASALQPHQALQLVGSQAAAPQAAVPVDPVPVIAGLTESVTKIGDRSTSRPIVLSLPRRRVFSQP